MEVDQDKLQEYKDNHKTQFLASQFETELVKLREAEELAVTPRWPNWPKKR